MPWNTFLFLVPRLQLIIRYLCHHLCACQLCFNDSFLLWCSSILVLIKSSLIQSIGLIVSCLMSNNCHIKLYHITLSLNMFLLIPISSCYSLIIISAASNHYWLWSICTACNMLNYAVKSLMSKYAVIDHRIMILSPSLFCILWRQYSA